MGSFFASGRAGACCTLASGILLRLCGRCDSLGSGGSPGLVSPAALRSPSGRPPTQVPGKDQDWRKELFRQPEVSGNQETNEMFRDNKPIETKRVNIRTIIYKTTNMNGYDLHWNCLNLNLAISFCAKTCVDNTTHVCRWQAVIELRCDSILFCKCRSHV